MKLYVNKISLIILIALLLFIFDLSNEFNKKYSFVLCVEDYKDVTWKFTLPNDYPNLLDYNIDSLYVDKTTNFVLIDNHLARLRQKSLQSILIDFSNSNYNNFVHALNICKIMKINSLILIDDKLIIYNQKIAAEHIHEKTIFLDCSNLSE